MLNDVYVRIANIPQQTQICICIVICELCGLSWLTLYRGRFAGLLAGKKYHAVFVCAIHSIRNSFVIIVDPSTQLHTVVVAVRCLDTAKRRVNCDVFFYRMGILRDDVAGLSLCVCEQSEGLRRDICLVFECFCL